MTFSLVNTEKMLKQKQTSKITMSFVEEDKGRYVASYKKIWIAPELHVSIPALQLPADLKLPGVFAF